MRRDAGHREDTQERGGACAQGGAPAGRLRGCWVNNLGRGRLSRAGGGEEQAMGGPGVRGAPLLGHSDVQALDLALSLRGAGPQGPVKVQRGP